MEKRTQAAEEKQGRKAWTLREFGGKTLWDWLQLLIVPAALAVVGFLFTMQQDARQQQIENQRAEAEQELANQRAQDEMLQAYLDQMSVLMLEKDLRNSKEDSEVRTLARARTLTVLRRLDTSRKDETIQFLLEADLVHRVGKSAPVIELGRADLSNADLYDADLGGADLSGADLSSEALVNAPTDLSDADLYDADLHDADLGGADLPVADLSGAKGFTKDQLDQARTLEGVTMPNGQKYEDWLKDR